MPLKHFIFGLFVKVITGFDDTITHIPLLASVTRTRFGKIAFSIGTLLAISLAIVIAVSFAAILKYLPYYRYIAAGLIFALAAAIYFDVFVHKPRIKAEKLLLKYKRISIKRSIQLIGIGFIASFATVLDDIIVYSPLFISNNFRLFSIFGIFFATILEIILVIYFSEKIAKIKYKEEIASLSLIILGILILTEVL